MADMVREGAAWLASQLSNAAGFTVTLKRGELSATVSATVGRSTFETQTQSGFVESWESRDYIVLASDYPWSEPVRGDTVEETVGGITSIYEVTSPQGTPLFHHSDGFQNSIRIHTKRVS